MQGGEPGRGGLPGALGRRARDLRAEDRLSAEPLSDEVETHTPRSETHSLTRRHALGGPQKDSKEDEVPPRATTK